MRQATLCLLIRGDEILLAMKKRGFGIGRWNGVGGKQKDGESILEAAAREAEEEAGIKIKTEALEKVASLKFYFPETKAKDYNQEVHVFFVRDWEGEPTETEEMRPCWFKHENIPFSEMWPDDIYWLPKVLEGKKLEGEFYFADEGNSFEKFDIKESSQV